MFQNEPAKVRGTQGKIRGFNETRILKGRKKYLSKSRKMSSICKDVGSIWSADGKKTEKESGNQKRI